MNSNNASRKSKLHKHPTPSALGNITNFTTAANRITLECGSALLQITPERDGIVRIRMTQHGRFGRDHSWSVIDDPTPTPPWRIAESKSRITLTLSNGYRVQIQRRPCRIAFLSPIGDPICSDDPRKGICWDGNEIACHKTLFNDDHFFALGEKCRPLDKRGTVLVNWNTDDYHHEPWTDPLYQSHPFVLVLNRGHAYGIFFDNACRSWFDLGKTSTTSYSFGADRGEMNYYFIPGPTPADVLRRYALLIGTTPLPPQWALGYHQCRWGYKSAARVRKLARDFRSRKIPCDVLWLDIDYMDGFRCFTWHPANFAHPKQLLQNLDRQGFKTVAIIDPGIKRERGYAVHDSGMAGNHFCRQPNGKIYVGKVWPGESVFPDFTRAATRDWWGKLNGKLLDVGIVGIWNDMNEPSDFSQPTHHVANDVRVDNDGKPTNLHETHNIYGMQMARATFEGCQQLRPNQRPFVLTRAGFAGVQRYAAVWTGDNRSSWDHLRMSIPMLLNMGLSNIPFCGADIGGFREAPTAELYTRWLQLGIFYPFCRTHTGGGPEQDPFSYGAKHERINRKTIELRYRLLSYIYTEFRHACEIGLPLMRPLLLDFPNHPNVYAREYEFMFGRQLLVAPIVEDAAKARKLNLPAGQWYDFATGSAVGNSPNEQPCDIEIPVTLESIPIFAKAGAIIPLRPIMQYVNEKPLNKLTLRVFPGEGEGWFYNDDGSTIDYQNGEYVSETYRQECRKDRTTLTLSHRDGIAQFTPESYAIEFVGINRPPRKATLGISDIPPYRNISLFSKSDFGWFYDKQAKIVHVQTPRFETGQTITLHNGSARLRS